MTTHTVEPTQSTPKSTEPSANKPQKSIINVTAAELPICCPPKDQAQWNLHPRVYLALDDLQQAHCPYCGNQFTLNG